MRRFPRIADLRVISFVSTTQLARAVHTSVPQLLPTAPSTHFDWQLPDLQEMVHSDSALKWKIIPPQRGKRTQENKGSVIKDTNTSEEFLAGSQIKILSDKKLLSQLSITASPFLPHGTWKASTPCHRCLLSRVTWWMSINLGKRRGFRSCIHSHWALGSLYFVRAKRVSWIRASLFLCHASSERMFAFLPPSLSLFFSLSIFFFLSFTFPFSSFSSFPSLFLPTAVTSR